MNDDEQSTSQADQSRPDQSLADQAAAWVPPWQRATQSTERPIESPAEPEPADDDGWQQPETDSLAPVGEAEAVDGETASEVHVSAPYHSPVADDSRVVLLENTTVDAAMAGVETPHLAPPETQLAAGGHGAEDPDGDDSDGGDSDGERKREWQQPETDSLAPVGEAEAVDGETASEVHVSAPYHSPVADDSRVVLLDNTTVDATASSPAAEVGTAHSATAGIESAHLATAETELVAGGHRGDDEDSDGERNRAWLRPDTDLLAPVSDPDADDDADADADQRDWQQPETDLLVPVSDPDSDGGAADRGDAEEDNDSDGPETDSAQPAGRETVGLADGRTQEALKTTADIDRPANLSAALEAILLVVDEPVPSDVLAEVLGVSMDEATAALEGLAAEYTTAERGIDLRRAAGGWRLYTRGEYASYVERFVLDGQSVRLTQAALETLAVIAYQQPVTRSRMSAIRGVNCDGVVRTLSNRGLIEECGTQPDSGAFLYRTTLLFLEKLGLDSLDELPPLAPFLPDDVNGFVDA